MASSPNQQQRSPLIYFFTSRSDAGVEAFRRSEAAFPDSGWCLFHIESPSEQAAFNEQTHTPDIVLSFLNPFVIPSVVLTHSGGRAFNVHPALPDYPGRDPQHFAFYEGATSTGATLHRMESSVDSGEILDVIEAPTDRSFGVMHFINESERLSLEILSKNLPAIIAGTIRRVVQQQWRDSAKSTRKMFMEMCRIEPDMNREEVARRIESFFNPSHRSIYIDLHGYRFIYEPDASGR